MKFPLKIAWRFLKAGKGQTLLILAGIAIGISVQVFIGLLIQGLQISLVDSTIGNSSQVTIEAKENNGEIFGYEEKEEDIRREIDGLEEISPTLTLPAFISLEEEQESAVVRGFDFEKAEGIYGFEEKITEGSLPLQSGEVMVGVGLAENLDLAIGDSLEVFNFQGDQGEVKITGLFDIGVTDLNDSWLVSGLGTAQELFQRPDSITGIEIQVEEVFDADIIGEDIQALLGEDVQVSNWKDANQDLLSGLQGQDISSIMIQIFVVIAVVLGISSVLAISVLQRSKQIGILKAMGVNDRSASLIFLFQGLILGIMGGLIGIGLGLALSYSFMIFATNPDGSPVVEIVMNYNFIALSFAIAVVASTLAALIPAKKSSKLQPIEVIRNG
ncbi:ABC transporter permease [Isachenkonia alkalipeptolytica]|uniref:ABC transporter permease n=1 Tax=Isachenkonia alkalipeptolytica TaxID=2565777 RepID=A0AA43XII4_9CLOT|nr:FtsX-like permease family protein [Isachenkonia alkalipeptolytica]NBG86974.1 ABC transporter permease [Isachenkonia alkalipeptolytica]